MMRLSREDIARRAEAMVAQISSPKLKLEMIDGESVIGGGAAPTAVLPTRLIGLSHRDLSADDLCRCLRQCDPPVIARVEESRVLLDLRTVFPEQDSTLAGILRSIR